MDYLRKRGTDTILPRTRMLSKRDDMIPVSEEEAKRVLKEQEARHKREAAKIAVFTEPPKSEKPDEPPKEKTIDEMDMQELRQKADLMKLFVHPSCKIETIRDKIKATLEAEALETGKLENVVGDGVVAG